MSLPAYKYSNGYIYRVNCLPVVCLQSLAKVFPLFYEIDFCVHVIFLKRWALHFFLKSIFLILRKSIKY